MTLVVCNQGEGIALEAVLNKTAPQNLVLKLYSNDVTPGEADTEATYTECAIAGYAAETLTAASWVVTPGAPTAAAYPEVTFTLTGAGSVYGYYLVQAVSGKLVWAERGAGAPYVFGAGGGTFKVTPQLTLD